MKVKSKYGAKQSKKNDVSPCDNVTDLNNRNDKPSEIELDSEMSLIGLCSLETKLTDESEKSKDFKHGQSVNENHSHVDKIFGSDSKLSLNSSSNIANGSRSHDIDNFEKHEEM